MRVNNDNLQSQHDCFIYLLKKTICRYIKPICSIFIYSGERAYGLITRVHRYWVTSFLTTPHTLPFRGENQKSQNLSCHWNSDPFCTVHHFRDVSPGTLCKRTQCAISSVNKLFLTKKTAKFEGRSKHFIWCN